MSGSMCPSSQQIWNTITRIQDNIGFNDGKMADLMAIEERQYREIKRNSQLPTLLALMHLATSLNVSFDSLLTGAINFRMLGTHTSPKRQDVFLAARAL